MNYITSQDIQIPIIALGTWAWGSGINGSKSIFGKIISKKQLLEVFNTAYIHGFTLWDTAPIYGFGSSEKLLGEFCKDKDVLISTKFSPIGIQRKPALINSFNNSCKRLSRNTIDIFWIHTPNNIKKWTSELIPLLLKKQVKIVGVSNHNLQQIKEAEAILEKNGLTLGAIQNHYSIIFRNAENHGILKYCQARNILFFSYMVLEQGALTGIYTAEKPFPKHSRRGKVFSPDILAKLNPLQICLKSLALQYNVSVTAILIAWAILKKTIPLVGITKADHIISLLEAISINLSNDDISLLENIADSTNVSVQASWE